MSLHKWLSSATIDKFRNHSLSQLKNPHWFLFWSALNLMFWSEDVNSFRKPFLSEASMEMLCFMVARRITTPKSWISHSLPSFSRWRKWSRKSFWLHAATKGASAVDTWMENPKILQSQTGPCWNPQAGGRGFVPGPCARPARWQSTVWKSLGIRDSGWPAGGLLEAKIPKEGTTRSLCWAQTEAPGLPQDSIRAPIPLEKPHPPKPGSLSERCCHSWSHLPPETAKVWKKSQEQ